MQAFAPRCLAEADEADGVETVPHFTSGIHDCGKGNVGAGIKIEHESAGDFGIVRLAVPGVEFEGGDLGDCCQSFDPVNLQVGFRSPETVTSSIRFDVPGIAWR